MQVQCVGGRQKDHAVDDTDEEEEEGRKIAINKWDAFTDGLSILFPAIIFWFTQS